MDSAMAISNFMAANKIISDEYGNLYFQAFVEYRSSARNTSVLTDIKIIRNGYHDGNVDITESDDLTNSDYHLGLTTKYQKYSFNDTKLLIKGSSHKMGGNYTITISVI
ncbi:hypothetical protein [Providencia sp. PROV091]|uniref:hypothetical protein n=1 Tax=Providencia sp. PROV091 TaxID=2949807 RepID=UPI00234AFE14|nr:hypothetical protein [Providencia sp. PROV091]